MAKTHKQKKGAMTIPQLRKAFDHIESYTANLLKKKQGHTERRKAFQKEWSRVFHRSVSDKAADAYLHFESRKSKKSGTRKQKGGQMPALSGAPLDYSTRPGVYGVYGEFPAYVTSGFDIYNKINLQAPVAGCGKENITPDVPLSIGSNEVGAMKGGKRGKTRRSRKQKGGLGFSDYTSSNPIRTYIPSIKEFATGLQFRPIQASVPSPVLHDASMAWKGAPLPASSSAATATPGYMNFKYQPLANIATAITRDLGEIRTE